MISRPGMWLQRLTTAEPDDDMIEVAIASVNAVFDWREFQGKPPVEPEEAAEEEPVAEESEAQETEQAEDATEELLKEQEGESREESEAKSAEEPAAEKPVTEESEKPAFEQKEKKKRPVVHTTAPEEILPVEESPVEEPTVVPDIDTVQDLDYEKMAEEVEDVEVEEF